MRSITLGIILGLAFGISPQLRADVVVTVPTGGNNISADKAVNSTNGAGFVALGSLVISEAAATDFESGDNQTLILTGPEGWRFNPGVGSISFIGSRDVTAASLIVATSNITITFSTKADTKLDALTISGVQVQALDGANMAAAGYLRRLFENPGTAVIAGIELDFSTFGLLNQIAGTARALTVQTQPSANATAGAPFVQQPEISIVDQFGNLCSLDNTTIVTATRAAGSGPLQGSLSLRATFGTVTYTNLSHNNVGPMTIQFAATNLISVTSATVMVGPAPADRLYFATQPGSASAGVPFGIQPVVKTRDQFGNDTVAGLPGSRIVTLALSSGSGTLTGTTSLDIGTNAGNGVIAFTDLQLDAAGASKQITASASGMTNAVSTSFGVSSSVFSKLQLLVPGETAAPGTASGKTGTPVPQAAGTPFNVTVNAVDATWNIVDTISDLVGITSSAGTASLPANASLVSGTKTFSVTLNTVGSATLTASDLTDGGKTPSTGPSITVGGGTPRKLAIQTQPSSNATAGVALAIQPSVRVEDAGGNLVATDNGRVITVARGTGTGMLQGTLTATTVNGIATFANLSHNVAETITLNFTAAGLTNAISGNVVVGAAAADRLAFSTQPGGASRVGAALATQPVVRSQDAFGNPSTIGLPANLNVNLTLTSGSGSLLGVVTLDLGTAAGNGMASFSNLECSAAGTNKQLTASAIGLDNAVSGSFNVGGILLATGGIGISADSTGGAYTSLTSPVYFEAASGDVGPGTFILNAPAGFVFDTGGTAPSVVVTRLAGSGANANNINGLASGTAAAVTSRTTNQITFTVSSVSSSGVTCSLTWQGVRVRPSAGTPLAAGNLTKSGTASIAAVTAGSTSFGVLSEVAGAASRLTFITQPGAATAGAPFGIQPVVRTRDQFGNDSTTGLASSRMVSLALTSGTGVLLGITNLDIGTAAGNGVVTFTDLEIDVAQTNKQLTASASGFTNGTSSVFSVLPAAASKLVIQTQPSPTATAGAVFVQQPVIWIADQFGNLRSGDNGVMVTAARNAGSGSLQGTTSASSINGVVSFGNLAHNVGTTITIDFASAGLTSATSGNVVVSPAAANKLAIQVQPASSATAGTLFAPQPVIRIEDQFGNLRSSDNSTAVIAARGAGSGTLQGTTSRTAINGIVSFTDLSHNVVTNISVLFTSGSLISTTSTAIAVGPALADRLVFTTQPGNAIAGAPFGLQPVLKTRDPFGNDSVAGLPASLMVTVNLTSGSGALQGTATLDIGTAAGNGTVSFANLRIDASGTNKQLTASASGMTSGLSSMFTVSAAAATKLAIQTQPSGTVTAGAAFPTQPVIRIEDQFGNLRSSDNSTLVSATRNAGTAVLQGAASVTAVNGLATFANLSYNKAETITVNFSGGSLTGATSSNVTVSAGAANKLVIQTQPSSAATAGEAFPIQPVVRVEDQFGNLRSGDNTTVVSSARATGSGTLQGVTTATASGGLASFSNLSYPIAESMTATFSSSGLTSSTSSNVVLSAGPFAKLQLLVPGETAAPGTVSGKTGTPTPQTADNSFDVTVRAVDTNWNLVNSVTDLIGITSSDGAAILPGNAVLVAGMQNFGITLSTTGSRTITATDLTDGGKTPSTSPAINVIAAQHTAATGGGAISADTVGGTWTALTGPVYSEVASGNIGVGTIILNAPSGFVFDIGGTAPNMLVTRLTGSGSSSDNVNGLSSGTVAAMTSITSTQLTFTVTSSSQGGITCRLTWQNVRVRPVTGTPLATGKLSRSGTANVVALSTNSNLGLLREVPGAASRLAIQSQPSSTATAGLAFAQQPVLRVEDKFGNLRTNDNSVVAVASRNAGSGTLQGTVSRMAVSGLISFTNLSHNVATNITLLFSSGSLTNATSAGIAISPAAVDRLVFTAQPGSSTYGAALSAQPVVKSRDAFGNDSIVGLGSSKIVTLAISTGSGSLLGSSALDIGTGAGNGTVAFSGLSVNATGTGKQLSASATGLTTALSGTFDVVPATVIGSITATSRTYDGTTAATIATRTLSGVLGGDVVSLTGGTASFVNKNVGVGKTVTATGLSLSGADAGKYQLASTTASTTASITGRALAVNATATNKVYNGTTAATVSLSDNRVAGDSLSASYTSASFADKHVGAAKLVSVSGISLSGTDAGNYTFNNSASATASITARALVVSATGVNKVYDATTTATVSLSDNRVSGDNLTTAYAVATFVDKNVGVAKPVNVSGITLSGSDAGNYTFNATASTTASVTVASLTALITADDKVYDATTAANIASRSLSGVQGSDAVSLSGGTATFASKNVGAGKSVTATGLNLSGADMANYQLVSSSASTTADITARALTVSAAGVNKVYDATTAAVVTLSDNRIAGDSMTTSYASASFSDKNVGITKAIGVSGISVTGADAGNYTANTTANTTANITAASLTGLVTADNKVYDGTTAATIASRSLSGVLSSDSVSLIGGTAAFVNENVGIGKTVTAAGLSLGGGDAGNYQLASTSAATTANITARSLTISATGVNRVYNGTTTATVTLSDNRIAGDILNTSYVSANFDDKNVGMAKSVNVSGITVAGTDAANYTANTTANTTADITARALTISATGLNKVYDATSSATVTLSDNRVAGDSFSLGYISASFADKNVGSGKSVSVNGITVSGTDAGNYTFNATASTTANITAKGLTVTGIVANNKIYDGNTSATLSLDDASLVGVIGADTVTLNTVAATSTFSDKNVGPGKAITVGGLSLSGAGAGNYNLSQPTATADITKALLTVTADNKTRAAGQPNPTLSASYAGFVGGETLATSGVTGSPALNSTTTNAVGAYPITAALGTLGAANYSFAFSNGTLTVTAAAANKLVILTQPSATATAGVAFSPQPQIRIEDQYGNLRSGDNSTIVTAVRNAGSGALQGTVTATAVNGVASFANLSHHVANTINLNFTSSGLTGVTSDDIFIGPGAFTKLQLLVPGETAMPGTVSGKAGTPVAQTVDSPFTVRVNAVDNYWNLLSAPADTVGITTSDSFATLPTNAPLVAGARDFLLALNTAGFATVTATDLTDGSKSPDTSSSIPVDAAQHTAATGGNAISADTTGGTWTSLTGPVYTEAASGNVGTGTILLKAPSGFIFDIGGTAPTVLITRFTGAGSSANNINGLTSGSVAAMTSVTATQMTFTVTSSSQSGITCRLTWQNVRVRPAAGTPLATGKLSRSGTANVVALSTNSNLGSLREIPGAASRISILTQPSATATAGALFAQQPMLGVADKFGNLRNVANGTPDNTTVITAARNAGSGLLQGTLTAKANDGVAAFTNLSHHVATNITIQFSSGSLTNATSSNINVNPGTADRLVFVTQPANGVVGAPLGVQPVLRSRDSFGNDSAVGLGASRIVTISLSSGTGPLLGTATHDIGTGAGNGVVSCANLRVDSEGANKQLTVSAVGLTSAVSTAFSVVENAQSITFGTLANRIYGDASFTVNATASSGLPISYSIVSGPATIAGNTVSITGSGTVTVRAAQAGDNYWAAATPVDRSFSVAKATLTVAAENTSRTYGTTNPTFTANYSGFVNGDNLSALSGTPTLTTTATLTSSVAGSPYSINITQGTLNAGNYNFNFVGGTLTITKAGLTVTADNASRPYGQGNPAFAGSISGLRNGDNIAANYASSATSSSPAGTYDIVPSLSDPNNKLGNYNVSAANGTLTVTKVTLAVTANNQSRVYGSPNPAFTVTYSGFVNGDDAGMLSGSPAFNTTATASSSVGGSPYAITASLGTLDALNYSFAFVDGELTITPASSAIAVMASANPSPVGSNVTFTATLFGEAPSTGVPTGTVQFFADGAAVGSPAGLVAGTASLVLANLMHGVHTISAAYAGDGNFIGSSNVLASSMVVNSAPTLAMASYTRASNAWIQIPIIELMTGYPNDVDGDVLTLASVGSGTNGATVLFVGESIYYLPSTSHPFRNSTDHLTYAVTDGYPGGSATNVIRIQMEAPLTVNPAVITGISMGTNGAEIVFAGSAGVTYHLERTTALGSISTIWEAVGSTTTDGNGHGGFTDSNPPAGQGFYRVVRQ